MRHQLALLTIMGALSVVASTQAQTPSLKVGSDAPALQVTFVKGDVVKSFRKGTVYVVEFWATWCGPCRENIPHLTELAKKYRDQASIIGVSVFEDDQAQVEPFVKKMGEKMAYHVAMDSQESATAREGKMTKTWLEAAGQDGIPFAIVVDQESKIAWMGQPKYMADVLDKIVNKTWDRDSYAKTINEEAAKREADSTNDPIYVAMNQFNLQMESKQYDKALAITSMIEKSPASTNFPDPLQLGLALNMSVNLKKRDMRAWYKTASRYADAFQKNPTALSGLAWQVADPMSKLPERRGPFAVKVARQAAKVSDFKDGAILDVLAWSYRLNHQRKLALATEKKALACKLDDDTRKELTANLTKLRKG